MFQPLSIERRQIFKVLLSLFHPPIIAGLVFGAGARGLYVRDAAGIRRFFRGPRRRNRTVSCKIVDWRSLGKSKKVLKSMRLPISDLQSPPLSCNDHFDNWQTSLSWRMGCRSGMPQERARRRLSWDYTPARAFCSPRKRPNCVSHVSGMNCHLCLRNGKSRSRLRESQALPRKRDGSIGFPIDRGCSHRLNRAVAKREFLDRAAPRTKLPVFPTSTELVQPLRFEAAPGKDLSNQSPAAKHSQRVRSASGSFRFRNLSHGLSFGKRHI
jgi:hypothetical protein